MSSEGPYRVESSVTLLTEQPFYMLYLGTKWIDNFEERGHADKWCAALNSAHHTALSPLASEVRELVGGVQDMLQATDGDPEGGTTWWASQGLRLALSAPGIQKLLKEVK